ncbi:hypothetical protein [Corallococcus silvisoli]|uniref:hypothetical protein n=1 Tax=Corallococcus silvisoli TaxID=2697031 RepID=UPI00137753E4|nr:hypothetical protein [Corallococcus silvisoli]NBD08800.1 hypothetical protein [Corallococcus silvisoli]
MMDRLGEVDAPIEKKPLQLQPLLPRQKQPEPPLQLLHQGGAQPNLLRQSQKLKLCPNCHGPIPPGGGGCPDCGHKLRQPKPGDVQPGENTLALELVLTLIDRWINTFNFWKDFELQPFELTKKDLESNTFSAAKVVDSLLRLLARPIPFSNQRNEMALFHVALRKVVILAKTQKGMLVKPNDFDLLFRRVFLNRLNMLKYLLHLHERGEQPSPMSSPMVPTSSLMDEWRIQQRQVWTMTMGEAIYQEYLEKHQSQYVAAMKLLKQQKVLPGTCGLRPASIIELSECNLCFVIDELNTKLKPKGPCVSKTEFYQLLYSGKIYQASGYSKWQIDPLEVKKTYTRLSQEEDKRQISLTCAEWMLYEHLIKLPMYFKHGTETEAIKDSHALMSPTVGHQNPKYTSKTMDAKFGHIEYVFGRLEFTYNAMTGGSRYGDTVLCMGLDEIGPELCISLHDQGIPFDNENTHKSVVFKHPVRKILFRDKHCSEWLQDYGEGLKIYNCFLFEVFYGQWGCRAALALSLIRELRRYRGQQNLLDLIIENLSVLPATIDSPEKKSVATLLHEIVKAFFRTEIRVPCVLSLEEPTVVTIFDQTVDQEPRVRDATSQWARPRALPYVDYGREMSVKRLIYCLLRIAQINLEDAGFDFEKQIKQKFHVLQGLCTSAAQGNRVTLNQVQEYFRPYKGKLDKLDAKKKVKKTKRQAFVLNCDSLCGVIHQILLNIAELARTGHSDLLTPLQLRSMVPFNKNL